MRNYIITTDSTVDLPIDYLESNGNKVLSLSYLLDGITYEDMDGLSSEEFYKKVREGALPTTSQINPDQAKAAFEQIVKDGKDILHIAFSSGLSGSYNSARIAAEELMEKYEGITIKVIDSLCASMGEGLLLYKVNELKKQGHSLEEVSIWASENLQHICHNFTVDDLNHLHRGGRVSKATAIIGTMVNIKPILHVDTEGHLINIGKIRGRKKSLTALVDRMEEQIQGYQNDIVMISHGDCIEDANYVAKQVRERFGIEHIMIHPVGPVIGTHSGPGTIALFFMGNPR
ncbi:DegV family protein [Lachnospiraceae bacterium LCP25S3_G4]